jgi:hypothetical protein
VEKNPANQQVLSDGWFKYFGFRIPAEKIVCDGCMTQNPNLIDQECPVRPCVNARGLTDCGKCKNYDCEKLQERWVVYEEIAKKAGEPIPPDDRKRFIEPYENKERITKLRNL